MNNKFYKLLAVAMMICLSHAAHTETFTVTNLNDAGPGSLRQAMLDASVTQENDVINVMVSGVINLVTAEAPEFNVFPIFSGVTINGDADGDNEPIVLLMTEDISGRFFQMTDAIINDVVFDGGRAFLSGGAIFATGTNELNRCLLINGQAGFIAGLENGIGGGIRVNEGTTTMTDCTMRNNTAGRGAAVSINRDGTLTLVNCTMADNIVYPNNFGQESTIWLDGTLNMTNCIIADTSPDGTTDIFDLGNTININVNNLVENFVCAIPANCGDETFASMEDPMLLPTSDDPYFVFMLSPDSPIANSGIGATVMPGGVAIPNIAVQADMETIPTLGEWGIILLGLLMMIVSLVAVKTSRKVTVPLGI